jgi:hypothetical protein
MSKETSILALGTVVFFTSFLGIPREYKEWIFIGAGILLMVLGYRLRRHAFLRSIEHESGERRADAFSESGAVEQSVPLHKDSERAV